MADLINSLSSLPDFYSLTGASGEQIAQAERALSLRFADDYRQYVRAFGAVSAAGHELTGVCASKRLNVVEVTLSARAVQPAVRRTGTCWKKPTSTASSSGKAARERSFRRSPARSR